MALFLLHLIATCFMTGVIWIVQVVHYPLFANVGETGYAEYQRLHMRKITWVVMPAMVFELVTAILLLIPQAVALDRIVGMYNMKPLLWLNLSALGLIWLSTALFQVPEHKKLTDGFEQIAHDRLVRSNWIRTIIWSGRVVLLFYLAMSR